MGKVTWVRGGYISSKQILKGLGIYIVIATLQGRCGQGVGIVNTHKFKDGRQAQVLV